VDNTYRPVDAIPLVSPIPVLIMHSKTDKLVDVYHANRLFGAALEPKKRISIEGDHNNIFTHIENRRMLLDYLSELP
jgi:hypothetical protein